MKVSSVFRLLVLGISAFYFSVALAADDEVENIGQKYYETTCAKCHEVGIGPDMKGKYQESVYKVFVRSGSNAMPAFRVTDIDDKTLEQLAKYLANYKETDK